MRDLPDPEPGPGPLRFSVLGPLSAEAGGRPLDLGPLKQRLVLATLLCHPGTVVSVDLLTEAVWGDRPPRTTRKNLQVYVSALRRTLAEAGADDRLLHRPGGYLIRLAESELDSLQFHALVRASRAAAAAGGSARAAELLGRARRLWTGPPLVELAGSEPIREAAERLAVRYLVVSEDWAEAALTAGRAHEVAETTGDLLEAHPLRERLCAAHMTALHRAGRRTEALAAYDGLRQHLSRELGLSPSPALESRYRSILADEGGCPTGPQPAGAGTGRQQHAPVVLPPDVPDLTGRESLLRELMERADGGGTLSVLVGPAGVGKTSLAVRAAHGLEREFPGGRICVRLRADDGVPRSPASLIAELLQYAGPAGARPATPEQAAAIWRTWLADQKVLLVLDDAPDEATVRPLLPGTGPSSAIVTARTRLAGLAAAHRIDVPPYSPAEALELLGRIVGRDRVSGDVTAAEHIVAACGLLPLAVRAAGLKLAVLRHLPLAEYAARLTDPRSVLDELAVGDNDVRSRVADEWRQLDESARSALLHLAAAPLARAFTLREAATALRRDPVRAQRQLESLIERGAVVSPEAEVTAHAALYSLPHFTRLYARHCAGPTATHCQ